MSLHALRNLRISNAPLVLPVAAASTGRSFFATATAGSGGAGTFASPYLLGDLASAVAGDAWGKYQPGAAYQVFITGDLVYGQDTITSVSNTTGLRVGAAVVGYGIQSGTTVQSINAGTSTITLSLTANQTVNAQPLAVASLLPGDTLYFRAGNYHFTGSTENGTWQNQIMCPIMSGTAALPITIRNYPGEQPVLYLDGGQQSLFGSMIPACDYVRWLGLTVVVNTIASAFHLGSTGCEVGYSTISSIDIPWYGDNRMGIEIDGYVTSGSTFCDQVWVHHNEIHGFLAGSSSNVAQVTSLNITGEGSGYTTATVTIEAPWLVSGASTAQATATISGGKITGLTITSQGYGYQTSMVPQVVISDTGGGTGAVVYAYVSGSSWNLLIHGGGSGYTAATAVSFQLTLTGTLGADNVTFTLNGSSVVTGVAVGDGVTGTGVQAGTTVSAISATAGTITLSKTASGTTSMTITSATAAATPVVSGGVLTGFTGFNAGTSYVVNWSPTVAIAGDGTGATATASISNGADNSVGIKNYAGKSSVVEDNHCFGNQWGFEDKDGGLNGAGVHQSIIRRNWFESNVQGPFIGVNQGDQSCLYVYDNVMEGGLSGNGYQTGTQIYNNLITCLGLKNSSPPQGWPFLTMYSIPDFYQLNCWNNVVNCNGKSGPIFTTTTPYFNLTANEPWSVGSPLSPISYFDYNVYTATPTYQFDGAGGPYQFDLTQFQTEGFEANVRVVAGLTSVYVDEVNWQLQTSPTNYTTAGRYGDPVGPRVPIAGIGGIMDASRYGATAIPY